MTFGEKLTKLRKEKGLSQEELAFELDVSRQAVSRWERDSGYPEIEKLLRMGRLFHVTLDYLLNEENEDGATFSEEKEGTYVSLEMLDGYLSDRHKRANRIAAGCSLLLLSNVCLLSSGTGLAAAVFYWFLTAAGCSVFVWQFLQPKRYREISSEPLLFDEAVAEDFRSTADKNRKKYAAMMITGVFLFFVQPIFLQEFFTLPESLYWLIGAVCVFLFLSSGLCWHAEKIILEHESCLKKKRRRGRFRWVYGALPVTAAAVAIGVIWHAWNPYAPILILFCALLVTVCKLLLEKDVR